ncbi:hypothetical protein K491DRAFT_722715 [Lophiostoma macrostomum CBS 122681]|uniref:Ig-like domain-containing protein n=1 Tax=Lophiostoma macrostomum CBS 122681 TaxID=1314788 RepID=A0A6A6SQ41_9PLEO|nr:hypothetical protein K491DRAFT_722715 [Lophiostoma macrostomum CBS 122681]
MFILTIGGLLLACMFGSALASSECKRCPYTLCPNVDPGNSTVLSCWTNGSPIGDNDTIWLKTTRGCYYTEYDLPEHEGDYTEELPYCGSVAPNWTTTGIRTKYLSDCYSGPTPSQYIVWTTWYKTTKNCYIHELTLHRVEDADELDDCGPARSDQDPHDHDPPTTTTTPTTTATATATTTAKAKAVTAPMPLWTKSQSEERDLEARGDLQRRFLYNTTAAEDYINCTTNASLAHPGQIERTYEYGEEIILQCGTYGDAYPDKIFLLTTQFCYIKDNETDPTLFDSSDRWLYYPHCEWAKGADE